MLGLGEVRPLSDPAGEVERALDRPLGTAPLAQLAARALAASAKAGAVVVISDSTRPVPYRGPEGILWPVLRRLLEAGFAPGRILVLVATGTHRPLEEAELRRLLDPRVFQRGIPILNHDSRRPEGLLPLGRTSQGEEILINRRYMEASLRILTGLVESHFIAGVSGGRKSICPGLLGEQSTRHFHGARVMASPGARDLNLEGNPCHEEALEVARLAGAEFIVNVTLDKLFRPTGVFAGELELAHRAAFEHLRGYAAVPFGEPFDAVVTHAGFVGLNHYQSVKAALAALPAVRRGGRLLVLADNTDADPVGSLRYRSLLHLATLVGAEAFRRLLFSPDWTFIPEQWEVQAWARVLEGLGPEGLVYYSPQMSARDCAVLPGTDGNLLLPEDRRHRPDAGNVQQVVDAFLRLARPGEPGREPRVAFLADGPYGILTPSA